MNSIALQSQILSTQNSEATVVKLQTQQQPTRPYQVLPRPTLSLQQPILQNFSSQPKAIEYKEPPTQSTPPEQIPVQKTPIKIQENKTSLAQQIPKPNRKTQLSITDKNQSIMSQKRPQSAWNFDKPIKYESNKRIPTDPAVHEILLKCECPPSCPCTHKIYNWKHKKCGKQLYICDNGDLNCHNCDPFFIQHAVFYCNEQSTGYKFRNAAQFLMAVAQGLQAAEFQLRDAQLTSFSEKLNDNVLKRWNQ